MLLLALILAATSVSSFNFSNSTYQNTTSISTLSILPTTDSPVPPQSTSIGPEEICDSSTQHCDRPGDPIFDNTFGTYNNPYFNSSDTNPNDNQTLLDQCANAFNLFLSNWFDTAPIAYGSTVSKRAPLPQPPPATQSQVNASGTVYEAHAKRNETSIASIDTELPENTGSAYYVSQFSFTASPPCCYNCTVQGGYMSLVQWPTKTISSPTSTFVNNIGSASTSPSVYYITFETLYATNYCGDVGKRYDETTLTLAPDDLSTARSYTWDTDEYSARPPTLSVGPQVFTKADWRDTMDCEDVAVSFWQPDNAGTTTFPYLEDVSTWWSASNTNPTATYDTDSVLYYIATYNPCSPILSVPTGVYKIDPSWTACGRILNGIWDTPDGTTANNRNDVPRVSQTTKPPQFSINFVAATSTRAFPTRTSQNNPYTTGLPPTPKTPPEIESDVAPPGGNAGTGGPGGGNNFIQKTTIISFVSAVPEIESPPTTAFRLGSQTLGLGQQVTYLEETYSLAPNGDFIVGSQTLNPGQQITDSGTTYSRASDGATLIIEEGGHTTTQILYTPNPSYSDFVIGTQTLHPGSQITNLGTTYSLATGGGTVIIDGTRTQVVGTITPSASLRGSASGTGKPSASTSTSKKSSSTREKGGWISASIILISLLFILEL